MNIGALVSVLLGVSVVTLDISLTSTAIPAIAIGLNEPAAKTIWIINIYYLAVIAALLPLAAMGEIFGHRRIFLGGLGVFSLGALLSGGADTLPGLMLGRALLGIGSAAVSATTPALIRSIYPAEKLGRGLGLYAMIVGIALTVGPSAASTILAFAAWHWLYWMSVLPACLALITGLGALPHTDKLVRPFDPLSAFMCAAVFASLLFGIASIAHLGWQIAALALLVSVALAYALSRRESGRPAPILAIDLFKLPVFALSSLTSVCAFTVQGVVLVVLPFFLMLKLSYTQVQAGWMIAPWPAALALMTLFAPRLAERIAPGILGALGLVLLSVGLILLECMDPSATAWQVGWRLLLCGVGFGLFQSPNMVALMTSAPLERSGGAGGILATSRLLGQSLGAAAVAFCLSTWPTQGVSASIWFGVLVGLLGAGASALRLWPALRQAH